ncbi:MULTISPECIES: hypothetical protein [Bacillaceae]|uniref:Uncharacterized protein n=1 Tax=Evansella alkalicola TaxID=745819 RepID=A0ABS6JMY3_9BACI|nr:MULTISPECIES: hypothetical protein [Bacillaceae]MBU9719916.1 hypothetical protein [Bacillus alkalicola]
MKRKLTTALIATPVSLLLILTVFFDAWMHPFELVVLTALYTLIISPFILLYGIPVTYLSDFARKKSRKAKSLIALFVHMIFAIIFGFVYPMNWPTPLFGMEVDIAFLSAITVALFLWITDEALRKINWNKHQRWCLLFGK